MGTPTIDYIVADPVLIPESARAYYTENVVYLPHSYQPNDAGRSRPAPKFSRQDLGLPERGFVFCGFNSTYKITPDAFDVWMRLLRKVDGSVLWLFTRHTEAKDNLRAEARKRGVDPSRLVFAEPMATTDHQARHHAADLLLDTFHCGAHTTASDALWMGLPLVTKPGETFVSRVAASALTAVGLPELIVDNADAYERLALELATNPGKLRSIKQRLEQNRLTAPLFDTARYTRNIEAAYEEMRQRYTTGEPPRDLAVADRG
jgi:predicted O-linked N-acetylglucosamine transferase (SPINDLY family)